MKRIFYHTVDAIKQNDIPNETQNIVVQDNSNVEPLVVPSKSQTKVTYDTTCDNKLIVNNHPYTGCGLFVTIGLATIIVLIILSNAFNWG